jgi:hypothetical protein
MVHGCFLRPDALLLILAHILLLRDPGISHHLAHEQQPSPSNLFHIAQLRFFDSDSAPTRHPRYLLPLREQPSLPCTGLHHARSWCQHAVFCRLYTQKGRVAEGGFGEFVGSEVRPGE